MLTTEQCRKILGEDVQISDERLERLRDELYGLADLVIDHVMAGEAEPKQPIGGFGAALALLPEADREEVIERAAIIEFDGGASSDEAERAALMGAIRRSRGRSRDE